MRRVHHAAHGLDAERQRHDVEQQHVRCAGRRARPPARRRRAPRPRRDRARQCGSRPKSSSHRARAPAGCASQPPTRTTSSMSAGAQAGVAQRLAAGAERALDDRRDQRLELGARRACARRACRPASVEPHLGALGAREPALRVLGGAPGERVRPRGRCAASAGSSARAARSASARRCRRRRGGCRRWSPAPRRCRRSSLQDRDVEGAAAEVVDGDRALVALVEAVGERRRGRLVDQAQHLEAGEPAGVARRLALAVVEVGRHGDDDALATSSPSAASARRLSSRRISAEISGGVYVAPVRSRKRTTAASPSANA